MFNNWLEEADDLDRRAARAKTLSQKRFLQRLYYDWAQQIIAECSPGLTIEIGGGLNACTREAFREISALRLDIVDLPELSVCCDAMKLPFRDEAIDNFIGIDVMHHIVDASLFLREAGRCLRRGGRLILIEPWNNWWSRWVYTRLHPEPFNQDAGWTLPPGGGPMSSANGALPWIVFARDAERFREEHSNLRVVMVKSINPVAFLLSGGSGTRMGPPEFLYVVVSKLEKLASKLELGLSALLVIEKVVVEVGQ